MAETDNYKKTGDPNNYFPVNKSYIKRKKIYNRIAYGFAAFAFILGAFPVFHIIYSAFIIGYKYLNWHFISTLPTGFPIGAEGGILNAIVGDLYLVVIASCLAVPLGIGSGLYLSLFGKQRTNSIIRLLNELMIGIPSVVWGIMGFYIFSTNAGLGFHFGFSALAGGLTLGFIMTPIVTLLTEQAVHRIPASYIEGALALGATKWQATKSVIVKAAMGGIFTAILLGVLNIIGQTAPLLFTNYYNTGTPTGITGPGGAVGDIAMLIFIYIHEPSRILHYKAEAAVVVLLFFVFTLDIGMRLISWLTVKIFEMF
ncbi:MAG: ABC transporter permease subunit [Deltaproteobacteria bacterium]|nr:ABC transporter permease subunit [Deltaproteobacteria bacterium]